MLWVPVLAALESFEDGAERPFAGALVLFQGVCFPGELRDEAGQSCSAPGRECAPAEDTIRALEPRVVAAGLEQLFERSVQRFRFFQGKLYRTIAR